MTTYPLVYKIEVRDPPAEREQLEKEGLGGCDALILHSIIFPQSGGLASTIINMDGRTGKNLSSDEMFKSWAMMAHGLAKDDQYANLGENKKMLCNLVNDMVTSTMLNANMTEEQRGTIMSAFETIGKTINEVREDLQKKRSTTTEFVKWDKYIELVKEGKREEAIAEADKITPHDVHASRMSDAGFGDARMARIKNMVDNHIASRGALWRS